jgi:pantetheine-phosphate adenylyltransferase
MIKAIYAGTFDPITTGHIDIIRRSMSFCDQLIIAIGYNSAKQTLFSVKERVAQINGVLDSDRLFDKNCVDSFEGLLADYAKEQKASILIRGIRSVSDFEYELTLAGVNKTLAPNIETVFLPTSPNLAVVSSSMVKEIAKHNGPLSSFVTPNVEAAIRTKFGYPRPPETGFIKYGDENK